MLAVAFLASELEDPETELFDRLDELDSKGGTFSCSCLSNGEADLECLCCNGEGELFLWYKDGYFEWLCWVRVDEWRLAWETMSFADRDTSENAKNSTIGIHFAEFQESRSLVAALPPDFTCDAVVSLDGRWIEKDRAESHGDWGQRVQELLNANHDGQVVLCRYGQTGVYVGSASADSVQVTSKSYACPACGERRVDKLIAGQGVNGEDLVRCMSCTHLYELPNEEGNAA